MYPVSVPPLALPACQASVAEVSVTRSAAISGEPFGGECVVLRLSGALRALSCLPASIALTVIA